MQRCLLPAVLSGFHYCLYHHATDYWLVLPPHRVRLVGLYLRSTPRLFLFATFYYLPFHTWRMLNGSATPRTCVPRSAHLQFACTHTTIRFIYCHAPRSPVHHTGSSVLCYLYHLPHHAAVYGWIRSTHISRFTYTPRSLFSTTTHYCLCAVPHYTACGFCAARCFRCPAACCVWLPLRAPPPLPLVQYYYPIFSAAVCYLHLTSPYAISFLPPFPGSPRAPVPKHAVLLCICIYATLRFGFVVATLRTPPTARTPVPAHHYHTDWTGYFAVLHRPSAFTTTFY